MLTSAAPRTVVVVGATGNQGSGVVRALLTTEGSRWLVRGITRDPNSAKAKSLPADYQTIHNRLTLVTGDVYDKVSLRVALAGAYSVFAVTSESHPGKVLMKEEEMQHEIEAGRNLVLVAEECGIEHFVFSSLPDMIKATGGRFRNIHHMNNKSAIERVAREKLSGLTCLIPADGVVRFCFPIPSSQVAQWTDPTRDVGVFAANNMVKTFTRVTGQPAIHEPISAEEFAELAIPLVGPAFKRDAKEMMEWAAVTPADKICYGALDAAQDDSLKELGLNASSFEDWLHRSGSTGPA
ncbi:hypothetical protein Plec18167_008330 [Paecilomyces lecythidis]|uniref:NmrA-like domain-containing protein n=1 Tax=Paecilomyces lecythidis TaxID=3004212 RepID=A0ABR3WXI7_9EURO